ncbi:MAG: ATP-binding cassette domain-containing protein, partial [Veillonella parvula]|nr:ATP-binding cassette domain-containing protein [Veillonella parvula]
MTNYAVELKNVCKRFPLPTGGELEACKDINITLEKGQSLGIVGESGSGKTTLVRMI